MRGLLAIALVVAAAPTASASFLFDPVPATLPASSEIGPATVYPTYPILTQELKALAAAHKDIARLHSAGQSASGLDLWVMEIADFENASKVPIESREVLWIDGGTHANEFSGVMFVLHVLKWLLEGYGEDANATWVVANRHVWIMPLLNPEGSMHPMGRVNYNLVNINRNYPVGWGDLEEAPVVNNPGPYPGSEAETRAVIDMWVKLAPDYMASIHCCGNLWLYPYGIEGRDPHPDDAGMLARVCDEAYGSVREYCGPIWSTIYPASGSSVDTAYEYTGAVAFGFEMSGREATLGWGFPFTTGAIEETESESWAGVMHALQNVHLYGARPEVAVESITADAVLLRVTNVGMANLTSATLTVEDARGLLQPAVVPWLAPGSSTTIRVPGSFAAGTFDVALDWTKRPLAPRASAGALLSVADAGGALVGAIGGAPLSTAVEEPGLLEAPLPALLALAAAGAALVRRRR